MLVKARVAVLSFFWAWAVAAASSLTLLPKGRAETKARVARLKKSIVWSLRSMQVVVESQCWGWIRKIKSSKLNKSASSREVRTEDGE